MTKHVISAGSFEELSAKLQASLDAGGEANFNVGLQSTVKFAPTPAHQDTGPAVEAHKRLGTKKGKYLPKIF